METFSAYWPCMKGIHQSPVDSPHKGRWSQTLMFSLICAWTNGWTNNQDAGDRRHHHAQWRHCNEVGSTLYYKSAARWDVWPKHYSLIWYKVFTIRALVLVVEFMASNDIGCTVYPKKYAHGFVVLCFVVVMQSFIMNSHEVFIHIQQGCFSGTGAIVRLPQCQWS